jgi:AbrB family looped-hinge helix DNA binding protein
MAQVTLERLLPKGQISIPEEIRRALRISPGDYVALWVVEEGVLLTKAPISPESPAEKALRELVIAMGETAEKLGLSEEDLDALVEQKRDELFRKRL